MVLIYEIMNAKSVVLFLSFFWLISTELYAQTSLAETKKNALVTAVESNDIVRYSFVPLSDYQEANAVQHVKRHETITGSKINIVFRSGKVEFSVDPTKVRGYDLDNLIKGLVVLHGYSDKYQIK